MATDARCLGCLGVAPIKINDRPNSGVGMYSVLQLCLVGMGDNFSEEVNLMR